MYRSVHKFLEVIFKKIWFVVFKCVRYKKKSIFSVRSPHISSDYSLSLFFCVSSISFLSPPGLDVGKFSTVSSPDSSFSDSPDKAVSSGKWFFFLCFFLLFLECLCRRCVLLSSLDFFLLLSGDLGLLSLLLDFSLVPLWASSFVPLPSLSWSLPLCSFSLSLLLFLRLSCSSSLLLLLDLPLLLLLRLSFHLSLCLDLDDRVSSLFWWDSLLSLLLLLRLSSSRLLSDLSDLTGLLL